jgi:hypothetical protein
MGTLPCRARSSLTGPKGESNSPPVHRPGLRFCEASSLALTTLSTITHRPGISAPRTVALANCVQSLG